MAEGREGISLKLLVAGVLKALREAKLLGDLETARLVDLYKKNAVLSSLTIPAFTISDTEVELRFSLVEPPKEDGKEGDVPDIRVIISPESLKGLEAHHVNKLTLKISSVGLRAFEETE